MKIKILISISLLSINFNFLIAQERKNSKVLQAETIITGKVNDSLKSSEVSLVIHGPFFNWAIPEELATQILTAKVDHNGEFKFKIPFKNSLFHVSLFLSSKRDKYEHLAGTANIADYLIEPGDSIHVDFENEQQLYTGKGKYLFEAQYEIEQTDKRGNILNSLVKFNKKTEEWLKEKDSILNVQLGVLSEYKSKISPIAYSMIKADLIGLNREWVFEFIHFSPAHSFDTTKTTGYNVVKILKELEQRPEYFSQSDKATLSPKYIYFLYNKIVTEVEYARFNQHLDVHLDRNYFSVINKDYTGILRDKLLAYWILQLTGDNDLQAKYLDEALSVMKTPSYIVMVNDFKTRFQKGQPIKDFDFKDAEGRTVHLADFKGKVVLIDMWFTGCHGCVAVAAGMPEVEKAFDNRPDVAFISISVDKDKNLWLQSIDKNPGKHYNHYVTAKTIYLYTSGTSGNNPFIKRYVPNDGYPVLLLIDKKGNLFSSTPSFPWTVQGQQKLITEINQAITASN